jgi:hypothetical protein
VTAPASGPNDGRHEALAENIALLSEQGLEAIRARNVERLRQVRTYSGAHVPAEFDIVTLLREVDGLRERITNLGNSEDSAADLSGWSAEENAEWDTLHGPKAAAPLRAANDRVWAIVRELRETAPTEGRDPYQDPMAQRLSAALVGVDGNGFCELPHMSAEEEDACDRRHYARGGVVSADALVLGESGCTFTLPSRADIEAGFKAGAAAHAAWSDVRAALMDNPEAQAGYQSAAEHHHKETQS